MFKNLLSSMLFGICNGLRPVASNHGISVGQFALSQISTYKVMWGNSSTLINVITQKSKKSKKDKKDTDVEQVVCTDVTTSLI